MKPMDSRRSADWHWVSERARWERAPASDSLWLLPPGPDQVRGMASPAPIQHAQIPNVPYGGLPRFRDARRRAVMRKMDEGLRCNRRPPLCDASDPLRVRAVDGLGRVRIPAVIRANNHRAFRAPKRNLRASGLFPSASVSAGRSRQNSSTSAPRVLHSR